jgi:hypothetical protein
MVDAFVLLLLESTALLDVAPVDLSSVILFAAAAEAIFVVLSLVFCNFCEWKKPAGLKT